jgi:hypothetical protein
LGFPSSACKEIRVQGNKVPINALTYALSGKAKEDTFIIKTFLLNVQSEKF